MRINDDRLAGDVVGIHLRYTMDLLSPEMKESSPKAGERVRQALAGYQETDIHHSLYLPVGWREDWQAENLRYPVLVEYTGNVHPVSGSTGEVKDANLGYGLTGGTGFIWTTMPCVDEKSRRNALEWWGDIEATVEYCKRGIRDICAQFGGDVDRLFICGFSRGGIATYHIGLHDDEIAKLWRGFYAHDGYDGLHEWPYPESDRGSVIRRLERLLGRPVLVTWDAESRWREKIRDFIKIHPGNTEITCLEVPVRKLFDIPGEVPHPHTDRWMHTESEYRARARGWLERARLGASPR